MSEFANKKTRGSFIAAVFSMQGFGILASSTVTMAVCSIFGAASKNSEADVAWRLILMLGSVPAAMTYYWRMMMPETARYTALVEQNVMQAAKDMEKVLDVTLSQIAEEDPLPPTPHPYPLLSREFLRRHGPDLFACSSTWFLVDIVFYSQVLFQSEIYKRYLDKKEDVDVYQETFHAAWIQAVIAVCSTIPGYFFSMYFIDKWGRVKIQMMGFFFMALAFFSIGIPYYSYWTTKEHHKNKVFMVLYGLAFFFANFGPNTTTFIVPAELFPGIAIGKLDLYVAAAGINPQRVLPVMIDVGTNNEKLLEDPLYLGLQQHRLDGDDYLAVVDEFMEAVFTRWPNVIVQFEDFQSKWAFKLLQRYRNTYRMFNDDVQGTAGVAIAGLLGAVRAQGRPLIDFPKQKIVVAGAGSAGIGVLNAARKTMARMLGNNEVAFESAKSQFWVVDAQGLITEGRENIDPDALPFARNLKEMDRQGLREGASLVEVVKQVKPDVLLGLSAVGGLFSKEVLEALKGSTSTRPAIFAMSNPTKNAECTAEEAFSILGDNIIFASGSPFSNVDLGNGHIGHCNQGNNMYLFPGIGLGTLLSGARIVSDGMLQAAAERLATYMSEEEVLKGIIFPSTSRIRDITKQVATAVIKEAVEEDLAEGYHGMDARELQKLSEDEIAEYVQNNMWSPEYPTLVYKKE